MPPDMHRSLVLATDVWTPAIGLARLAEERGLHRIWTTEYATRDGAVRALALAMSTERLQVGTGIAYAFTRLPLATAAMAADIQLASRGRFTLGLGAGTRGMRRVFYGKDEFDRPGPRLAEYASLLRAAWSARDGLDFDGEFYSSHVRGFSAHPELAGYGPPPVYGSGLNAVMLRHAARSFDGVALHPLSSAVHYLDDVVVPALRKGMEMKQARTSLAVWRVTSIDEDGALARERVKSNLAFYFSTPSYASVVQGTPWLPVAEAVQARFREIGPRWSEIAALVPDEMVEAFSLAGTPQEVADRLPALEAELAARGADELVFQTVGIGLDDEQTVENCRRIIETVSRS
ncbi:LLM class flavin-dependent oxidoreductase [Acrocarpospora catenulata]|uniref:LLM class flavin-dependent oxidoreductase n=1 Tax=Acrocarpospora catenulata TaxID=2836182 RepID=UPI001BDAAB40|nr:LLM class flavin-dependent oxidoreductase [Acrocarpospora catenulata]